MAHFYLNDALEQASVGDRVAITGAEARHAVTVSRIATGERVTIGNGAGLTVSGAVAEATPGELVIIADEVDEVPFPVQTLWLAQALAKGDRDEHAVQAATELGVDGVIPWAAQRSIVKWEGAKLRKGQERWAAIVREATKQSIRPYLPEVAPIVTTKQLSALAAGVRMLVLDPTADLRLTEVAPDERDTVVVVGPEGGIAPAELEQLERSGAIRVRLGAGVLRTGTAGPAAIAVLNAQTGRW